VRIDTHDDRPWHTDPGHLFLRERWLHQWAGGQNLDGTITLVRRYQVTLVPLVPAWLSPGMRRQVCMRTRGQRETESGAHPEFS
jgi:hypothetical protein